MSEPGDEQRDAGTQPGSVTGGAATRPSRRQRFRGGLLGLVCVSLLCGASAAAAAAGVRSLDRALVRPAAGLPRQDLLPALTVAPIPSVAAEMPDLLGMNADGALQVLVDAGLAESDVTTSPLPWAGPPGRVVQQEPRPGARTRPATLRLSAATTVPTLVGLGLSEARSLLTARGAAVDVVRVYRAQARTGVVLAATPAVGAPLPELVTLTLAVEASSLFLDGLRLDGSCSTGPVTAGGTTFGHALRCPTPYEVGARAQPVVLPLAGLADALTAAVALDPGAVTTGTVRVTVLADGKQVASVRVTGGSAVPLEATLRGAAQLSLVVTGEPGAMAVLGDAALLGSSEAMDRLAAS